MSSRTSPSCQFLVEALIKASRVAYIDLEHQDVVGGTYMAGAYMAYMAGEYRAYMAGAYRALAVQSWTVH